MLGLRLLSLVRLRFVSGGGWYFVRRDGFCSLEGRIIRRLHRERCTPLAVYTFGDDCGGLRYCVLRGGVRVCSTHMKRSFLGAHRGDVTCTRLSSFRGGVIERVGVVGRILRAKVVVKGPAPQDPVFRFGKSLNVRFGRFVYRREEVGDPLAIDGRRLCLESLCSFLGRGGGLIGRFSVPNYLLFLHRLGQGGHP